MKCKDCSYCKGEIYEKYCDELGYYKSARWMCYVAHEPFEVSDLNSDCQVDHEHRNMLGV